MAVVQGAVSMEETSEAKRTGPILFFDGGCALCHGAVRRLIRWESAPLQTLRFAPLDGATAKTMRTQGALSHEQNAVVLWTPDAVLSGEAAAGAALKLIGRTGWASAFGMLPKPLRMAGYRFTARHRHNWFGRVSESCPLPASPQRFLP